MPDRKQIEAHLELHGWRPTGWGIWHPEFGEVKRMFLWDKDVGIEQNIYAKLPFTAPWDCVWDDTLNMLFDHLVSQGYIGALQ